MFTLRAMRMMRLVRLRLSTSELVEARDITSRAVVSSGASWAAARPENVTQLLYFAIRIDFWAILTLLVSLKVHRKCSLTPLGLQVMI